jgi:plasmid stabilization system protein ParE
MKIAYLALAKSDLRWFKIYYMRVFPDGKKTAEAHFMQAQIALKANPFIGHPSERLSGVREFHIPKTPFTFIYWLSDDVIEILRVLDNRAG